MMGQTGLGALTPSPKSLAEGPEDRVSPNLPQLGPEAPSPLDLNAPFSLAEIAGAGFAAHEAVAGVR